MKKKKTKSMGPKQILAYIAFIIAIVWTLKFVYELTSSGVKQVTRSEVTSSTTSKSDFLKLSCVASDNTMTTAVIIDTENNKAMVQGNFATLWVTSDKYSMEYDMGGITVTFVINRNTGLFNEMWSSSSGLQYFDGNTLKKARKDQYYEVERCIIINEMITE